MRQSKEDRVPTVAHFQSRINELESEMFLGRLGKAGIREIRDLIAANYTWCRVMCGTKLPIKPSFHMEWNGDKILVKSLTNSGDKDDKINKNDIQ